MSEEQYLVFLNDGETHSSYTRWDYGGAVLTGDWTNWKDDEDNAEFQSCIKTVRRLNKTNLDKIYEKLPELWESR